MAYDLEKLLSVRTYREDRARHRLVIGKSELAKAKRQKQQKQKELTGYRKWRIKEEKRLFGKLKSKQASPHDLLLFNDTTSTLRQHQADKVQQLQRAGQAVEQAEKNLAEFRQCYVTASRKKSKIEEYKSIWSEAQRLLEQQNEDKEVEEHSHRPGLSWTDPGTSF